MRMPTTAPLTTTAAIKTPPIMGVTSGILSRSWLWSSNSSGPVVVSGVGVSAMTGGCVDGLGFGAVIDDDAVDGSIVGFIGRSVDESNVGKRTDVVDECGSKTVVECCSVLVDGSVNNSVDGCTGDSFDGSTDGCGSVVVFTGGTFDGIGNGFDDEFGSGTVVNFGGGCGGFFVETIEPVIFL